MLPQQIRVHARKRRLMIFVDDHLAEIGETPLPYYQKLMFLRRVLPAVVVKGKPKLSRAIIHRRDEDDRLELCAEGYGLRDVMVTDGGPTIA